MPLKPKFFIFDVILASIVLFPIILSPTSRMIGSEKVDIWNHVWGTWWWQHSLLQGDLPWSTTLLHYPNGGTLWFIDPVLAILGTPLSLLSVPLAYNTSLLLYLAFASWAARRFAIALKASASASWVASIVFVASAWMVSEVHNGITEAVNIGPVALALAWVEDAAQEKIQPFRAWAKAGLGIGLATMASPYLGLGVGIAALIRGIPKIQYAWLGGLCTLIVASPTIFLFRAQLMATDAIIKRPEGMNPSLALHNAVDPRTFVAPFGFQSVDLSSEGFVHSMYFGIVALIIGLKTWKSQRVWIITALCCMVFSLGPYLYWGDSWLTLGEARLRMPWFFLQNIFSGLAVTHPLRLAIPSLAIVAGLAAVGATTPYWLDRMKRLYVLLLIEGLFISGAPWPLETADAEYPKAYEIIKADSRDVGVLDLPTDAGGTMGSSRYLYWQTYHEKGIPYAPDARASTSSLLNIPSFRRLAAMCTRREDENRALGLRNKAPGSDHMQMLRGHGIGWIVLHHNIDPLVVPALQESLQVDLGTGVMIGNATVWRLD